MFSDEDIESVINYLCKIGKQVKIFYLWRPFLKDPFDDHIIEAALTANCKYIITYNKKDFLEVEQFGISVLTPYDFMQRLGTSYSLHYNRRYRRSGPIFRGPFQSVYIEKTALGCALLFLHLQSAKLFIGISPQKLFSQVKNYSWSSLPYYLGEKTWSPLLNKNKKTAPSFYAQPMKELIFKKKSNCG